MYSIYSNALRTIATVVSAALAVATARSRSAAAVASSLCIASGGSVGREGPSAHLGAASSNLPAQGLGLPNNSIRIIAASGAAAGIAASFNTPLAGAVFAMEVLLMEYSVATFLPVIMATVSATALTRAVFGSHLAYSVPHITLGTLTELVYILLCGILLGLLAGSFNCYCWCCCWIVWCRGTTGYGNG